MIDEIPCHLCGAPTSNLSWLCLDCADRNDRFECLGCRATIFVAKGSGQVDLCGWCVLRDRIAELSDDQRNLLRQLVNTQQTEKATEEALRLGFWPGQVPFLIQELTQQP
jgi:hypothetical protein